MAEWDIELLAKEVVINCGYATSKGQTLRTWKTLANVVNALKTLEQGIYAQFGNRHRSTKPGVLGLKLWSPFSLSLRHAPRIEKKFPFAASARMSLSSAAS
jgi:hypothetical protein